MTRCDGMMSILVPMVSRSEAAATRQRCAARASLDLAEGMTLRLSKNGDIDHEVSPEVRVTVCVGTQSFDVYVPLGLIEARIKALEVELEQGPLPDDLCALLLETALREDLDRLETICGRQIVIEAIEREVVANVEPALHLSVEQDNRRWAAQVAAEDDGLIDILMRRWPRAPRPMPSLPLPAVLRLGTTRLSQGDVASLRPGDVVLMQFADDAGARLVVAESLLAATREEGTSWILANPPRLACHPETREWTMQHDTEIAAGEQSAAGVDDLPVQLAFDIGQVSLTLGALRSLGVGAVLELNRDIQELVRISAHGALVGQGELVDVEGRAGVRIVRLFDYD